MKSKNLTRAIRVCDVLPDDFVIQGGREQSDLLKHKETYDIHKDFLKKNQVKEEFSQAKAQTRSQGKCLV